MNSYITKQYGQGIPQGAIGAQDISGSTGMLTLSEGEESDKDSVSDQTLVCFL